MSLTGVEPLERMRRFLASISEFDVARIESLVGDASNRAYFRIVLDDDDTRVVALLPEAFETESLPFLNVARLLSAIPVRVPEVIHVAGEQGVLVLEDSATTYCRTSLTEPRSDTRPSSTRRRSTSWRGYSEEAPSLKASASFRIGSRSIPEKFTWELDFFREHFLEGFRGCVIEPADREGLETAFQALSAELCAQTFVLCHRDYHSRNLMIVPVIPPPPSSP